MKTLITLLILLTPFFVTCQEKGYSTAFKDLVAKKDGAVELLNPTPNKKINPKDENSISGAMITITGIESSEVAKLKLIRNGDKIIAPQALDTNKNLVFLLKDEVVEAKGIFQIFHNDQSKGRYQFDIDFGGNGDGSKKDKGDGDGKSITDYVGAMANANFVGNKLTPDTDRIVYKNWCQYI